MKGSIPPFLPADRTRPPMTSKGYSYPKEKMPNGRDGRREEKGKEGGNLLSVPAKCQQTNLGPSSVCIHKLAGIIWSNDLLLVAYSTCIPSLSKSLFHMPFR